MAEHEKTGLAGEIFFPFCYITINLQFMIKVKIISMARKPKRNHEAYGRLGFLLPKQKELNNANIEQDVELGVTPELNRRGNKKKGKKLIDVTVDLLMFQLVFKGH